MSGIFDQVINYAPPSLLLGTVTYKGTWSAATNTPTLANPPSSITNGNYYVVSAAGTQFSLSFNIGDWIISNGSAWEKVDNTDAVSSVFGRTGAVVGVSTDYSAVGITNTALGASNPSTVAATTVTATSTIAATGAVTGSNLSGTNTGDQTITLTGGVTGSGTGSFAATVVTNANLTGVITSVGNATSIASQTGTGSTFVVSGSPTITTPVIAQINDASGNETLKLASIASAVNEVTIENATTGNAVHISATGGDASVGLHLAGKGASGYVNVQDSTDATKRIMFNASGGTTNTRTMLSSTQTVDRTLSLPDATDTLVGKATTDTLTNKTLTSPTITGGALNGTLGATTPSSVAATTGTFSSTLGVTGVATLGNGAILGTPASGTVTNLTGTASININGTVGATTPAQGNFTFLYQGTSAAQGLGAGFSGAAGQGFTLRDTTNSRTYYVTTETATGLQINAGANPITLLGNTAITGTLSATGTISSTVGNAGTAFDSQSATTGYIHGVHIKNTSGELYLGLEGTTAGTLITGDSAYDTTVRSLTPISFSANGGSALHARITSTGLNSTAIGATTPSTVAATSITATGMLSAANFSGRNRIVNGDMRIDQANAGAAITVSAAGVLYSVDKWKTLGANSAGVFTVQRLSATPPNGFVNYIRATVTTADAAPAAASLYSIFHSIEGVYCQDLQFGIAGNTKSITLSFQVRSSITGTFSGSVGNNAANRNYPFTFVIGTANTWTAISVTIPADTSGTWNTDTTQGIRLTFDLGSGTTFKAAAGAYAAGNYVGATGSTSLLATASATFDMTGVQLEAGTVATVFEQMPFGDMLRLCQREYFKTFALGTAPAQNVGTGTGEAYFVTPRSGLNNCFIQSGFAVTMRAVPNMTYFNPAAANAQARDESASVDCSSTVSSSISERQVNIFTNSNALTTAGNQLAVHYVAEARI